jgi:hypothetical protein
MKPRTIGNVYPSGSQNGAVYDTDTISPTLLSGQGVVGTGIGSCNAPKILETIYEQDNSQG